MPAIPASAVLLVALVATWPLFAWAIRGRFGVRAGIVPPLVSLVLLPFVVLGAGWAYSNPLVRADSRLAYGPGNEALAFTLATFLVFALLVGVLWARYVASPEGRRRADATLRAATVLVLLAGGGVAASGVARSLHAPDADGWASSLPQREVPEAVRSTAFEQFAWSFYDIRRDEARDLWVVTRPGPEGRVPLLALGSALVPHTVRPRDLAGIAPPRGWVLEGVGGVFLGLLSMAMGVALARRHVRRHAGLPSEHLGGGWLELEGVPPRYLPQLEHLAAGPLLVRLGVAHPARYRTAEGPSSVTVVASGTEESVADTARSIATVGYVMALAVVALSCAPLAVT